MQNEIELKIMVVAEHIPAIKTWLAQQPITYTHTAQLANTYFDTPALFFAQQQMGLRVRSHNGRHELTLKMKGDILGGLHIRPEYNLPLPTPTPDFKRLVSQFNLAIPETDCINEQLIATFSTDFHRQTWLIHFQQSEIEIALDQGYIKNRYGEEAICELEFELKQGSVTDLFDFIDTIPLADGMWLSSLSKAQRGYLIGQPVEIAKEIAKLTACNWEALNAAEKYRLTQQMADFIRLQPHHAELIQCFQQVSSKKLGNFPDILFSRHYLIQCLSALKALCQP